ncbi:TetR family transcriptional regulator [Sinobacterium caligoides]|uniref:TetR family transcriptional regulator n=1 Tax=Sinobacterium caligoides TaxID=933926 RepID=A0A3N2DPW0_9GAMM|nr:TetR/AcrR family transcriptional regulator [Sinobacterium caligoides]ROS01722.1 TetR family transcriptional regulator [Sinobacterium caligoides]
MARPRVRDKILVAAKQLFLQGGATAMTTKAVAAAAGVTEASVFNNFGDKAGLVRLLIEEELPQFAAFQQTLENPLALPPVPWMEQVLVAARGYFMVILPLVALPLLTQQKATKSGSELYSGYRPLLAKLRQRQCADEIAASVDCEAVAQLVMGAAMHGAITELTLGSNALGVDADCWASRLANSLPLADIRRS